MKTTRKARLGTIATVVLLLCSFAMMCTKKGRDNPLDSHGQHISVNGGSLNFRAVQNGVLPSSQTFTITNTGGGTLNWSVSDNAAWLDVSPTSGNSNSVTITVSINTTNLSPSTYNAMITVSSTNADNKYTLSFYYTVSAPNPHISLNKTSLNFQAVQNGSLPTAQTFTITNTGGGTLNWSVSDGAAWLDVSPAAGSSNLDTITVSINTTDLSPNTYNDTITVDSTNADNSPQYISVTYTVSAPDPHISLNKTSLDFQAVQNGSLPTAQTFTITNTGGGTLNWSVSDNATWLDVSPTGPTNSNSATITVSINTTNLSPSTYNATITVSSINADNSPQYVSVTYTVSAPNPHISLNPTSLDFQAVQNGSLPSSQTFTITNTGGGTLNWSVADDTTWLTAYPGSGNSNSETITVSITSTNLSVGTHYADITVNSLNADNSPQYVSVTFTIAGYKILAPPPPETLYVDDLAEIVWEMFGYPDGGQFILVEYASKYNIDPNTWDFLDTTLNDGGFWFIVPDPNDFSFGERPDNNFYLRIRAKDGVAADTTVRLTLAFPQIEVTHPKSVDTVMLGTLDTIRWNSIGLVDTAQTVTLRLWTWTVTNGWFSTYQIEPAWPSPNRMNAIGQPGYHTYLWMLPINLPGDTTSVTYDSAFIWITGTSTIQSNPRGYLGGLSEIFRLEKNPGAAAAPRESEAAIKSRK